MASRRALLVVYLVSLVYVRSAKCLGREEGDVGMGGEVGPPTALKILYIHSHQGKFCTKAPPLPNTTQPHHQILGVSRTWEEHSFI